jgi:hypothetical protein
MSKMSDHIDRIRHLNQPPDKPAVTATQLANQGKRCGNCVYWSSLKLGRCTLKDKHTSTYNICDRHADKP